MTLVFERLENTKRYDVIRNGKCLFQTESLSACGSTRKGAAIIIASGPSVKNFPIERYSHMPMFAVNGSLAAFKAADVRPYFYVCDDPNYGDAKSEVVIEAAEFSENVALSPSVLDQVLKHHEEFRPGNSPLYLVERLNRPWHGRAMSDRRFSWSVRRDPDLMCRFSLWSKKANRIGFSKNIEKGYFCARTVPYVAIQLAYHLGFSHVVLVGVDLSSGAGRFYEEGEAPMRSALDDDYEALILPSFKYMSRAFRRTSEFKVYNLFSSSRLPESVIPRLERLNDLDELLKKISLA